MEAYDVLFAMNSQLSEEQMEAIISKLEKKITDLGGKVEKTDKWGHRRLPFTFSKHKQAKEGYYVMINFKGEGGIPKALVDLMRVQEGIIRQMITKAKEEEIPLEEEAIFPAAEQAAPQKEQEESGKPQ
jgi:small subunit ribosomal protein S6